ncbi:hypothetical protein GMORB2_6727 [Geosmithia morbida]|uniref:Uncharacterized protein n=1 Tax=Geosmithia morbida TaxID=1094350 RepID=A0A9P4YVA5_9HYPO|nr:uncharacterized protein GMORB2_6727 [Geosmithia morbida]KAF4123177.1 hypothetical protein GMORB2_6727 [Geosmithia morbida]
MTIRTATTSTALFHVFKSSLLSQSGPKASSLSPPPPYCGHSAT